MSDLLVIVPGLAIFLALLAVGGGVGTLLERQHLAALIVGETACHNLRALTVRKVPEGQVGVLESGLVTGSVVISIDYFKRLVAGLIGIVGGEIRGYTSLLQRARREAILRMKVAAREAGYETVINVRIESVRIASSRADGKGTAGVEILAFGTGIRRG